MEEMNSKSKQSFYNYNLGMPFTDTKLQVTDSDILDNGRFPEQKHNRDDYALIAAGIDWGVKHTLVVSGLRSNGEIDTIAQTQINSIPATSTVALGSDIEAIRVFLAPFDPDIIIADIGDAGERVSRLIQLYGKDKVFGCKYSSDPTTGLYGATGRINATWNENNNLVTVDKLVEHKRLIDRLKRHDIGFWRKQDANLLQIIEHWKNVIIRDEEQANGEMRQVITRKAGDHSASAQVYSVLGLEHLQEKYYGKDSYDFGFDYAGDNMAPTPTDIQEQLGITFN